jgi:hypothetical protein
MGINSHPYLSPTAVIFALISLYIVFESQNHERKKEGGKRT